MHLPQQLQEKIEAEAARFSVKALGQARQQVTDRYRGDRKDVAAFVSKDIERISYVAARMPATFSVLTTIFSKLELPVHSLLDLGSGPGTALWAAKECFSELKAAYLIEKDPGMVRLAKTLAPEGGLQAAWRLGDLSLEIELPKADLVVCSYMLNELPQAAGEALLAKAWESAEKALVLAEPGTPRGFAGIRRFRELLIQQGAFISAPCPHQMPCPMPADDWCHFYTRIARSSLHRLVKEGQKAYEDEKFCYLIALKSPASKAPSARILRHPHHGKGHITFSLCEPCGQLARTTFSKKDKELYKQAKQLEWGDCLMR